MRKVANIFQTMTCDISIELNANKVARITIPYQRLNLSKISHVRFFYEEKQKFGFNVNLKKYLYSCVHSVYSMNLTQKEDLRKDFDECLRKETRPLIYIYVINDEDDDDD